MAVDSTLRVRAEGKVEKVGVKAVEWEEQNHVAFGNAKDEMIAFTRSRKPELKRGIVEARVTVHGHIMRFNTKATRWLRVYLYTELQFRVNKN